MSTRTATVVESKEGPKTFTVEVRDARGNEMLAIGYKAQRNAVVAANAINRGIWIVGNVRAKVRFPVTKHGGDSK